jgi:hypothetical protein
MEKANISGSIRISLTPDQARRYSRIWGRSIFWKKSEQEIKIFPLVEKIKDTPGVSDVWFTDDKDSKLLATIRVQNPDEGNKIASTISGYNGVMDVKISLGTAGPPPSSPPQDPS